MTYGWWLFVTWSNSLFFCLFLLVLYPRSILVCVFSVLLLLRETTNATMNLNLGEEIPYDNGIFFMWQFFSNFPATKRSDHVFMLQLPATWFCMIPLCEEASLNVFSLVSRGFVAVPLSFTIHPPFFVAQAAWCHLDVQAPPSSSATSHVRINCRPLASTLAPRNEHRRLRKPKVRLRQLSPGAPRQLCSNIAPGAFKTK